MNYLSFMFTFLILLPFSAFTAAMEEGTSGFEEVTIRVWHSALNAGEHYGHVSLATSHSYISLWPSRENRFDLEGIGCLIATAQRNLTYKDDQESEGRSEDAEYKIIVTNISQLEDEWNRLTSQTLTWFAFGTHLTRERLTPYLQNNEFISRIRDINENPGLVFNCASIVHHLLKKGDINLEDYLDIGSVHNPIFQGLTLTLVNQGRGDIKEIVDFLSSIIYPDKISYMARKAMIIQTSQELECHLDHPSFYLNTQDTIDNTYNYIITHSQAPTKIRNHLLKLKKRRDSERCILS
ncbi:hypothetical protein [Candidatus Odyssella acanthamoebae]|uniref:Uncharacterized protein n=1 Tax=Candidatus Odyssella acanthamoebae TaxID=91604 RepID=A0A077AX90_9PROT|nr:hypothetical protein [Candidatus Paracaedibacter acanthamoebae]AIK96599.1 hypothetical protein ID47_07485 [Candidatus Paracaedibacter acanthamoebae]